MLFSENCLFFLTGHVEIINSVELVVEIWIGRTDFTSLYLLKFGVETPGCCLLGTAVLQIQKHEQYLYIKVNPKTANHACL